MVELVRDPVARPAAESIETRCANARSPALRTAPRRGAPCRSGRTFYHPPASTGCAANHGRRADARMSARATVPPQYGLAQAIHRAPESSRLDHRMSVGTRSVSPMKPSSAEQMETLGRHFDTIRETQADTARDATRLTGQVDETHR